MHLTNLNVIFGKTPAGTLINAVKLINTVGQCIPLVSIDVLATE